MEMHSLYVIFVLLNGYAIGQVQILSHGDMTVNSSVILECSIQSFSASSTTAAWQRNDGSAQVTCDRFDLCNIVVDSIYRYSGNDTGIYVTINPLLETENGKQWTCTFSGNSDTFQISINTDDADTDTDIPSHGLSPGLIVLFVLLAITMLIIVCGVLFWIYRLRRKIRLDRKDLFGTKGESFTFESPSEWTHTGNVKWHFKNKTGTVFALSDPNYPAKDRVNIVRDKSNEKCYLKLSDLRKTDEGTYICSDSTRKTKYTCCDSTWKKEYYLQLKDKKTEHVATSALPFVPRNRELPVRPSDNYSSQFHDVESSQRANMLPPLSDQTDNISQKKKKKKKKNKDQEQTDVV